MTRRLARAVLVVSIVILVPVLGNTDVFRAAHIWILWVFGILASLLQPDYNPFTITAKPKDRGTGAQIIWSVYVTQLAAVLECAYVRYPESVGWDVPSTAAVIVMLLGLAIRTWAVVTLGSLFTMHISVQKDHTVVRHGPYRIVRHPSYLGALIMYLSSTVLLHAWSSTVLAVLVLPLAFLRRIRYEEDLLKEEVGEEYKQYCSEVQRLLPGIW